MESEDCLIVRAGKLKAKLCQVSSNYIRNYRKNKNTKSIKANNTLFYLEVNLAEVTRKEYAMNRTGGKEADGTS